MEKIIANVIVESADEPITPRTLSEWIRAGAKAHGVEELRITVLPKEEERPKKMTVAEATEIGLALIEGKRRRAAAEEVDRRAYQERSRRESKSYDEIYERKW